jgi:hypothetical protein
MVNNFLDFPVNKLIIPLLVLIDDFVNFYEAISDPADIHYVKLHKWVAFHEKLDLMSFPNLLLKIFYLFSYFNRPRTTFWTVVRTKVSW